MQSIIIDGVERFLGNRVPIKAASGDNWTVYGDVPQTPLIPRSRWDELTAGFNPMKPDHPNLPYVHDQDGIGQCNCDATAAAEEFTRNVMGLNFVKLSAGDLYDRINGGSDNGSLLEDAMAAMGTDGIATAEEYGGTLWSGRGSSRKVSAAQRSLYRTPEAYLCPTFDHCYSAVLSGFAIVSGILWYDNYTTDSDGWLPSSGRGRAGGHAIFGYKPTKNGSRYGIWHQNSWTTSFGWGGRMVLGESLYSGPVGGWWALRQATDEGGEVPAPKF